MTLQISTQQRSLKCSTLSTFNSSAKFYCGINTSQYRVMKFITKIDCEKVAKFKQQGSWGFDI